MCLIGKSPFGQMKLAPVSMIRDYKLLFLKRYQTSFQDSSREKNKLKKLFKNYLAKD